MTFQGVATFLSLVAAGALSLLMFSAVRGRLWAGVFVTGIGTGLIVWLAVAINGGGV